LVPAPEGPHRGPVPNSFRSRFLLHLLSGSETNLTQAIDITVPMGPDLVVYPGDTPPVVRRIGSIAQGAPLTASEIAIGCHVGTHVDAPAHFIAGGLTVDQLALNHFYGPAVVVEFPSRPSTSLRAVSLSNGERITAEEVSRAAIPPGRHVLIKTRNSDLLALSQFRSDYCYLTPQAAELLLELRPLSVGFDYYSLDPPGESAFPAHHAIARAGLPAFVCLDLKHVEPGAYTFVALPLPLVGVEAIPVRAVLFPG
jgi:arylformamidase